MRHVIEHARVKQLSADRRLAAYGDAAAVEEFGKDIGRRDEVHGQTGAVGDAAHFVEIGGVYESALAVHQFSGLVEEPFAFFNRIIEADTVHDAAREPADVL